MTARARKTSVKLVSILAILVMMSSLFSEPLLTAARPRVAPAKCSGGTITLFSGEATLTIENPSITNAHVNGCQVSGKMRIQLRGNDKGNIPIEGRVDAWNKFTSSSIGYFDLNIAGLTLKAYSSSYTPGQLRLFRPHIKIPDPWGGLEAQIPAATEINQGGLEIARFELPSIETRKGFTLDLSGRLRLASSGYEIDADGTLGLPDIGKTSNCSISVGVTLYADGLGWSVMEIHTPQGGQAVSLASNRSVIARPADKAALIPASMPLRSYYLPVPAVLSEQALQQVQNQNAAPAPTAWDWRVDDVPMQRPLAASPASFNDPAANAPGAHLYGSEDDDAPTMAALPYLVPPGEEEALAAALGYEWALWEEGRYDQPLWSSNDVSAGGSLAYSAADSPLVGPLPSSEAAPLAPAELGLREIRASATCDKGIPIGNTGFELTGVNGTISLRPNSQYVDLGITIESSVKVGGKSALKADANARFQWQPGLAMSISGALYVLSMYKVGQAQVSLSESDGFRTTVWMRGTLWEITVSVHAWTQYGRFHFTGSGLARVGVGKGGIWKGCEWIWCGVRWCSKKVWFVTVWYPCGNKYCNVCLNVPPSDLWIGGLGADFGEFRGGAYGFKAYVSFMGYTIGVFVNDRGTIRFGDVSSYKLVDSMQLARARQAWRVAQLSGAPDATFPGDDTFTFLADDQALVHFDLPLPTAEKHWLPLGVSDTISYVNVITQTDTLFSVSSDTPLTVTLVSPDHIEITPDNYRDSPGGYVIGYRQVVTYELERATGASAAAIAQVYGAAALPTYDQAEGSLVPEGSDNIAATDLIAAYEPLVTVSNSSKQAEADNESRWRFIPTSPDPTLWHVDVQLDHTGVFTDVWITGTQRIDYAAVDPGMHTVQIVPVGAAQPALTATLNVVTGTDYTVLAVGQAVTEALVLSDDNRMPADFGYARIRLVNVAPTEGSIDASLGEGSFQDVAYKQASDYQLVQAGRHVLSIQGASPWIRTLSGEAEENYFGEAVAGAGDVTGDGYDDVIIGARAAGVGGQAYLYLGGSDGLSASPAFTATGQEPLGDLGRAVAGAGDVNGDGYDDVVIGAPGVYSGAGRAYLYLGGSGGLSATPVFTATGFSTDELGYAVAGAGDINGDGYDDVIIGAPWAMIGMGQAYLYLGGSDGLSATAAFIATGQGSDNLGRSVAGAGDVNGDGYDDVIVGAPGASVGGQAYLYLGGSDGLSASPAFTATGQEPLGDLGRAVAGAGDVNGDDYGDVIIGAPFAPYVDRRGEAYLYLGGSGGLSASPAFIATGQGSSDRLGWAVAGAGDVNGDGYDDLFIGAPYADVGGQAYLYLGGSDELSATLAFTATGQGSGDNFGCAVAGSGDINGDGYADLIVGAPDHSGGTGRAYVYSMNGTTPIIVAEGDVKTLFVTGLGDDTYPLAVMETMDELYKVFTETQYVVDQAPLGRWSVKLFGDTDTAKFTVGAVAAPDPPVLSDLTVDASDLAQTQVSWTLLSDYLPVSIRIYANDGPITQTMVVTDSVAITSTETFTRVVTAPLYQGNEVATIAITETNAVKGEVVSTTVDLSILESGNYKLWVRAEDGVSPPVQGYVWGTSASASRYTPTASNSVRVAAEGYDPLAQLDGAVNIVVDNTSTFAPSWTAAITPTVNPRFWIKNGGGELEESLIEGLFVEFTPNPHPDVDSYVLEVSELGQTHVITTGKTVHFHYDETGQPVGDPVPYAIFNGISPKDTYTLRIGAHDVDSGHISWSQEQVVTIPLGDFSLSALQPTIERPAGQEVVTATLILTMTEDLFSDVNIYLETDNLPPGIAVKGLLYESPGGVGRAASPLSRTDIPAPVYMPAGLRMLSAQTAPGDDVTLWAHVALTVTADVLPASYLLPFVAYSGELQRGTNVTLLVGEPQEVTVDPNATQEVVLHGDLTLPSCATAIVVTIPPGTFATQTTVRFRQGSSNVDDWRGMRFAGSHFTLDAQDSSSGLPVDPLVPLSVQIEYDPTCLGGLSEDDLHLRYLNGQAQWATDGIACTLDPARDALSCGLSQMGEFALFERARVYLPLVVRGQ